MTRALAFELVIFDCDGVLVDSEAIANRVFSGALAEIGLPLTFEQTVARFVGRTMQSCIDEIEHELGRPVPAGFVERLQERTFAAFERELRPVPGIHEALDAIDVPVCVASSGDLPKMHKTLGLTGLLERFDGRLFSAVDVARPKPFPDLFLTAAERMGARPAGCAVVEDSPLGVRAGIAAGMTVFGYAGIHRADTLAALGAVRFDDMRELPELLSASGVS